MSGRKRIWVEEQEWRRLQREAALLHGLQAGLPGVIEGVKRQTARDLQRGLGAIDERQRAVEQAMAEMSEHARAQELRTNRRLAEQDRDLRAAIEAAAQAARADIEELADAIEETRDLLAEQGERLAAAIATEREDRRREMAELREEIARHRERAAAAAAEALRDATLLRDLIRDTLPHERFAPGILGRQSAKLEAAGRSLGDDLGEAALAAAQDAHIELSDLRLELEVRERRWRRAQSAAAAALRMVQGLAEAARRRPAVGPDGSELADVEVDVDHWSRGALGELEREVADLLRRVEDEETPMAEEDLVAVASGAAAALEGRLRTIVVEAGDAQLASQLRTNIAEIVAQTLEENGWATDVDGAYYDEDQRNSFIGKVEGPQGSAVVVVVRPVENRPGTNEVLVNSFEGPDQPQAEGLRRERARALVEALRSRGLDVGGDAEELPDAPEPAILDMEGIRAGSDRLGALVGRAERGGPAGA
jgi:hypothetical protein